MKENRLSRSDENEGQGNYISQKGKVKMNERITINVEPFFFSSTINQIRVDVRKCVYVYVCVRACGSRDVYIIDSEKKRKGGQMTRMSVSGGQTAIIHFSPKVSSSDE